MNTAILKLISPLCVVLIMSAAGCSSEADKFEAKSQEVSRNTAGGDRPMPRVKLSADEIKGKARQQN